MKNIPFLLFCICLRLIPISAQPETEYQILLKENDVENAYPRLSHDGDKILYQSNRTGKWQLNIMDVVSRTSVVLTPNDFNDNFPDWSADNKWIAFVSDRGGNEEIYLMNSKGGDLKRITNDPGRDIHPYFSPDGKYILFNSTRNGDSFDVYRYTISNGKTEQITSSADDETCARYSPDMKHFVYLKNNQSSDDVFVLNTADMLTENISKTPVFEHGWPMYSADGKWIYYSSMEGGTYSIYRVRIDGTGKEQLTHAAAGEDDARVNVSADGKLIIYNKKIGKTIMICSMALR